MAQNNWSLAQDLHNIQYFHGDSLAETAGLVSDWSLVHGTDDENSSVIVTDVNFNLDGEFGWTATVVYCGDKLADV